MKVYKYIFLHDFAMEKASTRFGIRPLSPSELFVLYSLSYLPASVSKQSLMRHAKRMHYRIGMTTLSDATNFLVSVSFVDADSFRYTISSLGRSYLSNIRRFLVNKRL